MYRMTPEKKEKYIKKLDKMMDFLEEFKECLDDSYETDEPEYRHDWEDYPEHDKEKFYREMANRYSKMRRMVK